ncbi:threonine aldolase family protein [Propionispora vibrioides]|uniref:L-threonine aldolase n=1 Tax=Propionispora vibrioides TaxID=112903 RepID=A0A1H8XD36_9FIRM|nr:GntG family PLP-dependent aldolase [Propionispora vibrioides]SEP37739.1 L-threonine aldolase [Propionispora vibrioides]
MEKTIKIDLRSDTVTSPSEEMREAIYKAKVGDHGYGEDETTVELEEYCAKYFGKEAGLFMASGTMSDQVSIRCWTQAGDEIILDGSYHINYFQAGPSTDLGKILLNTCHSKDGVLRVEDIEKAICNKIRGNLFSRPALISLENTINGYGGTIFPIENLKEVYSFAQKQGIPLHMDGERFLNACIATNIPVKEYALYTDSISTSFSKGLGAPFGSIIMGSKNFIEKAKKYRRWYGGSLHQSGFMAAAALFAIKNNVQRLEVDHHNAKLLGSLLKSSKYLNINLETVQTNMVMLDTRDIGLTAKEFVSLCEKKGVFLYPWHTYTVRAVTHLGISEKDVCLAASKIREVCEGITKRKVG